MTVLDYGKKCVVIDLDETLVHSSFKVNQHKSHQWSLCSVAVGWKLTVVSVQLHCSWRSPSNSFLLTQVNSNSGSWILTWLVWGRECSAASITEPSLLLWGLRFQHFNPCRSTFQVAQGRQCTDAPGHYCIFVKVTRGPYVSLGGAGRHCQSNLLSWKFSQASFWKRSTLEEGFQNYRIWTDSAVYLDHFHNKRLLGILEASQLNEYPPAWLSPCRARGFCDVEVSERQEV